MPGTRYSATFDRTYVEESPPPRSSPVRFSIQSWQGASLPGNPPLNGSYKHHARTASTDSLDSSGTGASSSSSGSGTGHSRQVSMEVPGESFMSTRTVIKTPSANHNALQFVKVGPVPLYKKAVEQIKLAKEVKVSKETVKEEEEEWQDNLDSWKSRRKKLSEKAIQRVEDLKLLEEDWQQQKKTKTKTFSEMMENRAQKPRAYNLSIYVENDSNDFAEINDSEMNDIKASDKSIASPDSQAESSDDHIFLNTSVNDHNSRNQEAVQSDQDHISNVSVDYDSGVYSGNKNGHETLGDETCTNSKGSSVVCAEEDCNGCGLYTVDSGLESFSSSQRAGDIQDSSSELSVDSSGGYDRGVNEEETDGHLGDHGEDDDLLKKISLPAASQTWPQILEQKDGYVQINLRLWLNSETKDKDFGFSVLAENGVFLVDNVKLKGAAWQSGLQCNDQILALNGESTSGRSKNSVLFAMKQSIYNGHLDLIISRRENEDTKDSESFKDGSLCETGSSKISSSRGTAVSAIKQQLQNGHSSDDSWKDKSSNGNALLSCSKSEPSRTWEEEEPELTMKKLPPPVPAKPKLFVEAKTESQSEPDSDSHAPIVRTISNEMKLERLCSTEALKYMSPDGVTDISKEMCDAEDELDRELVVYSESDSVGGEPAELVFCVEQDTRRVSPVSSKLRHRSSSLSSTDEDKIIQMHLENNETILLGSALEGAPVEEPQCFESEPSQQTPNLLHHVKQDNGLNIIFESHPSQSELDISVHELVLKNESDSTPNVVDRKGSFVQESQVTPRELQEGVLHQQQDIEEVLLSLVSQIEQVLPQEAQLESTQDVESASQDVESTSQDESQESEWVQEELSAICPDESSYELDSLLLTQQQAPTLHPDDQLLVDLESHVLGMEPPKEKPPPPPPADSPEQIPKMNTFKRVKKDLWKRRSDFLGIDPSGDEIDIDVPPPPDLSEILKSEIDLERQNRLWLEKERFLSSSSCSSSHERTSSADSQGTDDDEIARREREIIDNLEREEKAKKSQDIENDDQELVTAECQGSIQTEEDERIIRLQEERRRMEEERFQREEIRIRAEEDRIFKEREEALRQKEDSRSVESSNVKTTPQFPSLVANPPSTLIAGSKDSRPAILPKPNRLSRNLDRGCSEPLGKENGIEKEALELERERLLWEQERLQKEKEEYRRQLELEQRKSHDMKLPLDSRTANERQGNEKTKPPNSLPGRDAVIFASKKPQGIPETSSDSSRNSELNGLAAQGSDPLAENTAQNSSQQMNRNALHFLGAAPKARIIQSEQWINQQEPAPKCVTEPVVIRERGYNQNHWLVQEAEMRRITEQNERQQHQRSQSEQRRHSASPSVRPLSQSQGPTVQGLSTVQMPRHISSTAPRPYQRPPPPPPPPPKPPHGMPAQAQQTEQPWNYRPVAPIGLVPRPGNEKPYVGDFRKYRSESALGVPSAWTVAPAETQPEHLLSVSGKEQCSHCAEPLGRGGAMIIESLQLYYHMHCFCCCVCQAPLGNGTCGTDVRVRNHKLHCQNCYSNDEAGLKFSQV